MSFRPPRGLRRDITAPIELGALDDLARTIDGFCRERIYPFRNARRAFLLEIIFRGEVPYPPGAYFFCLSKRSRQENDTKGRRLEFAPANTCTLPFDPLPRYRWQLLYWVALPAQNWLRQFGSSRRPTPTESFVYRGAYHASGLRGGPKGRRGNLREAQ